jgi:hypothetical protein
MKPRNIYLILALFFPALAAFLRFWIAPTLERLSPHYTNEVKLLEQNQFRPSATEEWQASTLNVVRLDQVITNSGQTSIIEGGLHVYHTSGAVNFESIGLYGVDRRTRLNVPGYGDVNRSGQYLFPAHVQRIGYSIWDPMFIGLRQAQYLRTDTLDSLQIYVFAFSASGMDESAGYSYLPSVPESYLAHTDGQGTIWVEPLSGIVVDYEDSGVSYFVNPQTEARVGDFNQWQESYIPETRHAQLKLAHSTRLRILLLEIWLPVASSLVGFIWLGVGLLKRM